MGENPSFAASLAVLAQQGQRVRVRHPLGVVGERLGDHADGLHFEARRLVLLARGVQKLDGLANLRLVAPEKIIVLL